MTSFSPVHSVDYVTVDVFTEDRFAGNQLAVIPDARGLNDQQMQAIATEFGYSEVTFVLPPENPGNTARVRIFTPTMEIPFAGHPNVGTAFVLGRQAEIFGRVPDNHLRFEERAGVVEAALSRADGAVTGARIVVPRPLSIGPTIDVETIAACAMVPSDAIDTGNHAPVRVSVGLPFAVAELTDVAALSAARPNVTAFEAANKRYKPDEDSFSLFLYARSTGNPWRLRARMFAPLDNVIEDPATGSASAALSAYLVSLLPDDAIDVDLTIEQGVEMGRRSIIEVSVSKNGGTVGKTSIAGACVTAMRGSIAL
ncbi:PhzF family phenazine biosynthesis protein [Ensifer oleiphilus]|uniref:PhzF family phenazine biosynthesis protein n=1 Tax=Ensifer oleiphilus TaxID=2742698 RepID=UPI001AEE8337|nr:PhzF family phenazine biosynthesis protein [Ensifer oleiphilus]